MMRTIFIIAICLFVLPLSTFADPSTQRGKSNRQGPALSQSKGPPPFKKPTTKPAADPEEFDKALNFLEKASPNRFKAYQLLDEERRAIFRERIVAFHRTNQWIDRDDHNEMRKIRERVIRAEDDVFGVRWEILASGGPRRASDEERARLRAAVGDLVKLQLAERQMKLEFWKKWVKGEEDQIAAIEKNPDEYIEQRYRDELEGRGLGLFDHRRSGVGGGPPPGAPGQKGPGDKQGK